MSRWVVTKQLECKETLTTAQFLNAVQVWIIKPQVVNKHYCGSKIQHEKNIQKVVTSFDPITLQNDFYLKKDESLEELFEYMVSLLSESSFKAVANDNVVDTVNVTLRDVIPKSLHKDAKTVRELVIKDPKTATVTFIPLVEFNNTELTDQQPPTGHTYRIRQQSGGITMEIVSTSNNDLNETATSIVSSTQITFLNNQLLPKIVTWAKSDSSKPTEVSSLTLVPIDEYSRTYNRLKQEYGQNLVAIWPETTDPLKFVYEDCAIAAYLITLWNTGSHSNEGALTKQSFVDLGCGNGLLVYILSGEGHRGLGLDVRKRKIWDLLGDKANLQETPVTPSDKTLFPDYEWIIGNHSDELTPWIPVMAARSSYTTKYFVLPCCHYDFQSKFNERQQGLSSYRSYLKFVKKVGQVCGFKVEEDQLRIPSTKKVCFVGQNRTYPRENQTDISDKITEFIASRCNTNTSMSEVAPDKSDGNSDDVIDAGARGENDSWASEFKARSNIETTRNCTHVDITITTQIINSVFHAVLGAPDNVGNLSDKVADDAGSSKESKMHDGDVCKIDTPKIDTPKIDTPKKRGNESSAVDINSRETDASVSRKGNWRRGGAIPLGDVVKLFSSDILQQLKKECGGIQTLLKNHHYIFKVVGGKVSLRHPGEVQPKIAKKRKWNETEGSVTKWQKTKLCWFNDNHPDGCPLDSEKCTFAHGQNDLKTVCKQDRGPCNK
ncbi:unnamed protein product [Owenia fusiformis]|uniref:tRNA (uracil-O(2)-)-methyltransferase n=1 Tax=Owenia fusiformis TaxID=6347 RepID=A0A8J1TI93_OWEFU|nr:unnamed protein product [Owenia fusiformis]